MNIQNETKRGRRRELELDEESHLEAHAAFQRASNQRERVVDWFERCGHLNCGGAVPSVLAVGAGAGDIDLELIRMLGERGPFCYDAIDPSQIALQRFRERCANLDSKDAGRIWLHQSDFERFEPGHRYDLIHFIHTVYSIGDLRLAMEKAYRLAGEVGRLAMVCSTDEGVNAFKRDVFQYIELPGRPGSVPEASLLMALSALAGSGLEIELVSSELDIEACIERTAEGEKILSSLLQANFSALDSAEQEKVIELLERHCMDRRDPRRLVQPMLGISVRKNRPTAVRRVILNVADYRPVDTLADVACFA